ncbi:MAG: hypothetical protein HQ518_21050 [Rhodopirellula sp.]|nr:hypothetical protein [Rhodopirellula sp.]
MPEHEFEIYLSVLSRLMKLDAQQKAAIADELSDHLEERFEELVRSGLGRDEAIRQALDEFGDASGLAVDLTRVSQKRIRRILMRSSLATATLVTVGFGWMFLFPPANAEVETETRLVAQDSPATPNVPAASRKAPTTAVKISLDQDSSDFDAPFLKNQISVNFAETPLNDALQYISGEVDVPVLLDTVAVKEAGLMVDELIDFSTATGEDDDHGMRVDQLLDLMLAPLEMSWYVDDGILRATTIEVCNERLMNRSYDLAPFLEAGIEPGTLMEIVMQESSGLWETVDGSSDSFIFVIGNVMTIRQTYYCHRESSKLLEGLLKPDKPSYGIYHSEYIACQQALQKAVSVNFVETPLVDVAQFLAEATGTRIYIDAFSLEEAGLSTDEPVSLTMNDRSLATILRLVLRDLQLTTSIRSGELFITPVEVADENLHVVVYDVRNVPNEEQLTTALPTLASGLWRYTHGSGGTLSLTGNGMLVVRQTDQVHAEIADLLKMFAARGTIPASPPPKRTLETRYYRVPSETAEDLMSALPATIAPETWQGTSTPGIAPDNNPLSVGTILKVAVGQKVVELPGPKKTPQNTTSKPTADGEKKSDEKPGPTPPPEVMLVSESVLIIKQTAAVHNEIDSFMQSLNLGMEAFGQKSMPHGGGLGGGGFF